MHRLLAALALTTFLAASAGASERDDVMSVVHQWIDALDKGDMKTFVGLCSEHTVILDDMSPYQWQGEGACANWWSDASKNTEITDISVAVGKPLQIYITDGHAYVVTRDSVAYRMGGKPMKQTGAIHTFALQKGSSGWRISGEAWSVTAPPRPVKTGS
jgi:ketosteroid isomerase-like protein